MSFEKDFFVSLLYSALADAWYKDAGEYGKNDYIEMRMRKLVHELVEATDSFSTLSERLTNLETHTHDITKQYGECDRMFYECSKPIY